MMSQQKMRPYDSVKRGLDIIGAVIGLAITAPLFALVAGLVLAKLGTPILFSQERPGKEGKVFRLFKFRTMTRVDEARGLVTNEQRLGAFGRRLRGTSLDELPSLFNVLRGDMSLVGPRPLRTTYLARYSPRQARRHEVRPGITGLAQVRGRNALGWDERLELDVKYVETRGVVLDMRILFETVGRVFVGSGIEGDGLATMSAFMGAEPSGLLDHELDERWLDERVRWLQDPRIRQGISINFDPEIEAMRVWLKRVQQDDTRRDWVYTDGSHPVAMCGLSGVGSADLTLYLYVNPEMHGRGYGTRALSKIVWRARSFGAHRLHLEVRVDNEGAIRLYERAGFVRDRDDLAEPGKERMSLDLREYAP